MFKVIAKISVNQNDKQGGLPRDTGFGQSIRRTPPREGFSQSIRKSPPKEDTIQELKEDLKDDLRKLNESVTEAKALLTKKNKGLNKISKTVLINVCMVIAIFCYSTVGALIFQILEQHNELKLCEEGMGVYRKEMKLFSNQIMRYVQFNLSDESSQRSTNILTSYENSLLGSSALEDGASIMAKAKNFEKSITEENHVDEFLKEFKSVVNKIKSEYGYKGQDCLLKSKWKFTSSLLFVVTIISSIGYGFISPATWEGQLVCICYALIGMPIFTMTLLKLSTSFGDLFTFLYIELEKINPIAKWWTSRQEALRQKRREKRKKEKDAIKNSKSSSSLKKDLSNTEGFSITQSELDQALYVLDELDYQENVDTDDSDDEAEEEHKDEVPFKLMITIFICFLCTVTYIFRMTETWSFSSSFYFNLVTLLSIGFGDLVPGVDLDDSYSDTKLLLCCGYIFFGMAVFGTCVVMSLNSIKRAIKKLVRHAKKFWSTVTCKKMTAEDKKREKQEMIARIKQLKFYFDDNPQ